MLGLDIKNVALIDAGLVLYVGLFALFLWRCFFGWRCCGKWMQYANYCSLLLGLVFAIMAYDSYNFFTVARGLPGIPAWDQLPSWLRPLILSAPVFNFISFCACSFQTFQHVERIREESAVDRHDKAVQIILLPVVYSSMAMASLTRTYVFLCTAPQPNVNPAEPKNASATDIQAAAAVLARSETCFYVGDLYEAWALYQFGKLVLELIDSAFAKQAMCAQSERARAAGEALQSSHRAVESLAWLGIYSFLIVCVAEAGWSLWLLTFSSEIKHGANTFDDSMSQFTVAGFLASCAAIYNVYIVESKFHSYLTDFCPFMKFLTVKVLVTIAFVQRGGLKSLQMIDQYMPEVISNVANALPVINQLAHFSPVEFELFYASLIMIECFVICLIHQWAWNSAEIWYEEAGNTDLEKMPLKDQATDDASYGVQA